MAKTRVYFVLVFNSGLNYYCFHISLPISSFLLDSVIKTSVVKIIIPTLTALTKADFVTVNGSDALDSKVYNKEGMEVCPECGAILKAVWENVGFEEPEGPSKNEIVGVECPDCNFKD
jgi:hypothetical protein